MDRFERSIVPPGGVAEHPAFLAWQEIHPQARRPPLSIEILKPAKRKSAVYRIPRAGPSGASVIAKRQLEGRLELERRLYADVLPGLPLPTLDVYGFVESRAGYSWLFLEDAGDERYSSKSEAHRALAADWLATLHTETSPIPWLRRTGSTFQLTILRKAQDEVRESLRHPALTPANVETLERTLRWLDRAEEHWGELEALSVDAPETLVHGDFVPKNVRVRRRHGRREIVAFDWETSGWATPAVDLGLLPPGEAPLRAYQARIRAAGWETPWPELVRLRAVGDLYRLVNCVHWESRSFKYEWIERATVRMAVYEQGLHAALERSLGLVRAT